MAWRLARYHLDGLDTDECLWRPARAGLHVHRATDGSWRAAVQNIGPDELRSEERTRWPFTSRPFADVVAWANIELAKNASEIGYARFLYGVRQA